MIPLEDYLQLPIEKQHDLPEVLLLSTVPKELIQVSSHQPLLEENLRWAKGWNEQYDYFVSLLLHSHIEKELLPWRQHYETIHEPLELTGRNKETL